LVLVIYRMQGEEGLHTADYYGHKKNRHLPVLNTED
jgi:hypothetical protein